MNTKALLAFTMCLPLAAIGQSDTTRTDTVPVQEHKHTLEVGASNQGMRVQVKDVDDLENADGKDTIRIELKHKVIRIISTQKLSSVLSADSLNEDLRVARRERRNAFTYWSGIEVGINSFFTTDGSLGDGPNAGPFLINTLRSRWVSINFMEQKYEFGDHRAGFFWGLGLEYTGYHLSENVRLAYNGDSTYAVPTDDPEFTKNKIRQTGLRMPLMFEFNTKRVPLPGTPEEWTAYHKNNGFDRKGNFHFALGVVGSWYFETMYKQKFHESGEHRKVRDNGSYNLLPYRVSARAQIGVGGLNLFAEYGLTPLFEEGTAPELIPFNMGLTLIGFN